MQQSSNDIWPIDADTRGRGDFDFFVTNNRKYSIYYSNIDEYGVLKFVSPVQIWTGKEDPKLLFQSKHIKFEYQHGESCYYLDNSDILILLTPCLDQARYELLYILFDFNTKKFSIINAPNFKLTEIEKNLIRLDLNFRYSYDKETKDQISQANGTKIDLCLLQWHHLDDIENACSMITNNNR